MKSNNYTKLINLSFIILPILLAAYVYLNAGIELPPTEGSAERLEAVLPMWSTLRLYTLLYYILVFFLVRRFENKNTVKLNISNKVFVISLIAVIFSYAIGAVLVDLTYIYGYYQEARR